MRISKVDALSLPDFMRRVQVLALYRSFLRETRKIKADDQLRRDLTTKIKEDFRKNRDITQHAITKMLMTEANREFKRLADLVDSMSGMEVPEPVQGAHGSTVDGLSADIKGDIDDIDTDMRVGAGWPWETAGKK
jgi:ClpP class serine protease